MNKEKDAVLEIPEKQQDQFLYVEAVKNLVEQKKAEFQVLQGKIGQYKTQLISLERRIASLESEHKEKMLQERQNFEKEKTAKFTDMDNRFDALQKAESDYRQRKIDLDERELENAKIKDERKKLLDEKIRYEKLNTEAQEKSNKADTLIEEANKKLEMAAGKELSAKLKLDEIANIKSIVDLSEAAIREHKKEVANQINNLQDLRKEVQPKIEEYHNLIKQNEAQLKEIQQKDLDVKAKIEENNKLFEAILKKEENNKQKEIFLATKEEELLRKELLLKKE
jgi:chromosome segregation ATPase